MGKRFFSVFLTLLILSSLFSMPRVRLISPKIPKMDGKRIKYGRNQYNIVNIKKKKKNRAEMPSC